MFTKDRISNNLNLIHIHHRSHHHADKSGYSRMTDYMPVRSIYGNTRLPYYVAKIFSKSHSNEKGLYNAGSVWKEAELFNYLRETRNETSLVHYLNAERDIRYFVKYKNFFPNTAFCGTFHKPPSILKNTISNFKVLAKLDAAIAVGENQVEFLREQLNTEHISFIPHGVDTEFFKPDLSNKKNNTIIFVGTHLRDIETLNFCIPKIAEKIKDLKVNIVVPPDHQKKIKPHASIAFYGSISDLELRKLYNTSSLLFLPLKNVTACNSILEALACGLPIVSTDVGGNNFYMNGTKNILVPKGDNNYYIDAIIELLENSNTLQELSVLSREKALSLSWENMAEKVENFYKSIMKQ